MGHIIATTSLPRSYCQTYPGYPTEGFCFPTERFPGASSTRHRRFPGAIINIDGYLTKFWHKQFVQFILRHGVVTISEEIRTSILCATVRPLKTSDLQRPTVAYIWLSLSLLVWRLSLENIVQFTHTPPNYAEKKFTPEVNDQRDGRSIGRVAYMYVHSFTPRPVLTDHEECE